ncbi:unnamed protein product [Prorocentrum cordatum]|uniref:phosphoglycerate kinase n=1 Tax=Prorocentrum cordatum TaxID=2364126 RepID=A0ABN9TVB7_9DINO|nr:unnamed protein product [Polarella glacialis]
MPHVLGAKLEMEDIEGAPNYKATDELKERSLLKPVAKQLGEPTEKASECAPDSKAEKVGVLVSDVSVGDVLGLDNTRFCKGKFRYDPEKQEELRKQGALVGGTVDNSAEACTQDWFVGELSVEVGTQTVDQVEGEQQQHGVGSVKSDADRVPPLAAGCGRSGPGGNPERRSGRGAAVARGGSGLRPGRVRRAVAFCM